MGKLYIVATPIGNLKDITYRAVEILKKVNLIACEDTRDSKKLLDYYKIATKLISYHQHSTPAKVDFIVQAIKNGQEVAVITDAGTPGISDPGNKLVAEVVSYLPTVEIVAVPGPSALIAALSVSGLPTDRFNFLGFLPHKKGRETIFKNIAASKQTSVFYESTHRIMKTLERLAELLDHSRSVVVARELTKKFETVYRGNINQVINKIKDDKIKGEFVVIIK